MASGLSAAVGASVGVSTGFSSAAFSDFLELLVFRVVVDIGAGSVDGDFTSDVGDNGVLVGVSTGTIGGEAGGMTESLRRWMVSKQSNTTFGPFRALRTRRNSRE